MKKNKEKAVYHANSGYPTFSIGHRELNISPIVSNGDPHGL